MKSYGVTIQMNLFSSTFTWCYLFCMLFKLLSLCMKSYGVTSQIKPLAVLSQGTICFVCSFNF